MFLSSGFLQYGYDGSRQPVPSADIFLGISYLPDAVPGTENPDVGKQTKLLPSCSFYIRTSVQRRPPNVVELGVILALSSSQFSAFVDFFKRRMFHIY